MPEWTRIGDDAVAPFGRHSLTFAGPHGPYTLSVDERNQSQVIVTYGATRAQWFIEVKEKADGDFRLSGMATPLSGVITDAFWFELLLTDPPRVRYWGSQVLHREDKGA